MAGDINRVVITGRLTKDPELGGGRRADSVCRLRIATNGRRRNGEPGDWEEKPNYFGVTVLGPQGERCAQFLSKGRPVAIDGRLDWSEYEPRARSASRSISSLIPCNSSAGAMTPAAVTETGSPAAHARRRATFRSIQATSRPRRWVPESLTTTFRSRRHREDFEDRVR